MSQTQREQPPLAEQTERDEEKEGALWKKKQEQADEEQMRILKEKLHYPNNYKMKQKQQLNQKYHQERKQRAKKRQQEVEETMQRKLVLEARVV